MPLKTKIAVPKAAVSSEKPSGAERSTPSGDRLPFGKDAVVSELRSRGCVVTYEKSVTKNLGNYESAKITVAVTLPIDPTPDELSEVKHTLEIADSVVTEELELQIKELVEAK